LDLKTKRTIVLAVKNTVKTLLVAAVLFSYMAGCLFLSWRLTNDLYFGFAGILFPFVLYTIWDYSKSQVERELEDEERMIRTLSKKHEV
jgi:hypothetical protein